MAVVGGELLFGMFEYVVTHAPMKGWGNHVASERWAEHQTVQTITMQKELLRHREVLLCLYYY